MDRRPGPSVRLKLTVSYAGFLLLSCVMIISAVYVFLLRGRPGLLYVPSLADFQRALDPHNFGIRTFVPAVMLVIAFLLVFGLIGGWLLAGRMLSPLTRITAATRKTAGGALSHRIAMDGRSDEFRELSDSFDAMIARLETHVAEQQRFASNASHELRTPLAITQTLLDVARKDPKRATSELVDILHDVNTRAIDLTEALLLLSRADQRAFTREHVDLSLFAEEAVETLLPLAEKSGTSIEMSVEEASTLGSHALLQQMVTNLLHNAIVHNLPGDGSVSIATDVESNRVVLMVENTGDRLDPALIATLAEPFQRGTQRVHADQAGVGLGLAIVKRIAEAHDGSLALDSRPDGGLRVTVRLPATLPRTSA